jgi:pimeloyl-ACP methyl ester carboxylesterase
MATMTEPTTRTLKVPGAVLTYDVRPSAASTEPPLVLIGSPMGAGGFATLASHFPDRTVVTYDPRGVERSTKDDPSSESTPEQHGDDVHAIIGEIGGGPVDLFASSGGAVNALALVAVHPDDVHRLVAHEPPTARWLPDRDEVVAACADIGATYQKSGHGPAMAKFIALVMYDGELSADYPARPAPDPAMFGMSADDDGTRTDPLMRNMPACITYEPDAKALAALGERLIVGVGKTSGQTMAARGARSVAGAVGVGVTEFAGDHGGFLGGEFGQTGEPDAFAADLHAVLD